VFLYVFSEHDNRRVLKVTPTKKKKKSSRYGAFEHLQENSSVVERRMNLRLERARAVQVRAPTLLLVCVAQRNGRKPGLTRILEEFGEVEFCSDSDIRVRVESRRENLRDVCSGGHGSRSRGCDQPVRTRRAFSATRTCQVTE
jgi:hypothetical protein